MEGSEHGSILIFTAVMLVALITVTAFSLGIGKEADTKRYLRSVADIAAQDALPALGVASPQNPVDCAARISALRNQLSIDPTKGTVTTPLPGCSLPTGYVAGSSDGIQAYAGDWNGTTFTLDNSSTANAVEVIASRTVQFDFTNGLQPVSATAVATRSGITGVRVGSFAARLTTGSLLDQISTAALHQAFGGSFDLASYSGLASGSVTLGQLLAADPALGTPSSVLTGTVSASDVFTATVTALSNQGTTSSTLASTQLGQLQAQFTNSGGLSTPVSLAQLFGVSAATGDGSALSASANVLDLINSTGDLVDIADGTNFVTVNPTSISIPGVATISVKAQLISTPGESYGPVGTKASDTQASVEVDLVTNPINITTGLINFTGQLTIPIVLNAASGQATITSIQCGVGLNPPGSQTPVGMTASTSAVNLTIGTLNANGTTNANGNLGSLGVTVLGAGTTATVSDAFTGQLFGAASKALSFTTDFIPNLVNGEAGRGDPSSTPAGSQPFTVGTSTASTSTLTALEAQVPTVTLTGNSLPPGILGIVGGTTAITNAIATSLSSNVLSPVFTGVGSTLIPALKPVLGIDVGGADIWNTVGVSCLAAQLVK